MANCHCICWQKGYHAGREANEATVEGILARTFSQADPGKIDRDTWQAVLRSVEERAYRRGLAEGTADD